MTAILSTEEAKYFLKSKRHLLSTPNVVSLGFSNEKVDGNKTGGKIFRVGVIKKLPKESIKHPDIFIPKFFEHTLNSSNEKVTIPVIIVEEGELVCSLHDVKTAKAGPRNEPPYKGASLIKNAALTGQGCLGANAQYEGSCRLLSAAHVLTKFDRDYIGKQILVENEKGEAAEIGATVTDQVDVVLYDTPTEPQPVYAKQDLAWANITKDRGSPEIMEIGTAGSIRKINPGEHVKYYGGRSLDLRENVEVEDIMATMKLRVITPSGSTKYGYFEDVCRMEPLMSFLNSGDSGTAIVAQSDNALLGILMTRSSVPGTYYFCKLML